MKIETIKSNRELKEFILLPWKIYQNDPNWVPPLIMTVKEKLDRKKHPFFEHAQAEYFIALKDGQVVGRIAGIVDNNHNDFHNDRVGFFGMYECFDDEEAASALIEAASEWVRKKGMDTLRGPVNMSMNDECGFLIEGFNQPPVVMMPYNPSYYLNHMEKCGLRKVKDLYAYRMDRSHQIAGKVIDIVQRVRQSEMFNICKVRRSFLSQAAGAIKEIYNKGWVKNWGFVPWTEAEMAYMVKKLAQVADFDIVLLAWHKGRPVGFAFGLPNLNEVLVKLNGRLFPLGWLKYLMLRKNIKGVRAPVFGVVPEFMHTGLAHLLYDEFEKAIRARGYEWCELSWQLEDNEPINRFVASIGAVIYKKYRIYEKNI